MKWATVRDVFGTGATLYGTRTETVATDKQKCPRCPHQLGAHACVATSEDEDPLKGGVMLCHVKLCRCYGTWSVPQLGSNQADVRVPDVEELMHIMTSVQTVDPGEN